MHPRGRAQAHNASQEFFKYNTAWCSPTLLVSNRTTQHGIQRRCLCLTVQRLRCLGGSLGWEGDEGRYSESEEEGSVTSIKIKSAEAGDTGLFTCGSAELGEKVESVYLFVEDPRHLFRDTSPLLVFNVEVQ